MNKKRSIILATSLSALATSALAAASRADIIYSNDFQSGVGALTPGGTLTGTILSTTSLPTDSAGLASPNQSAWLGTLGAGVPKTGGGDETVSLHLPGLTPGTTYYVAFDLFIGASWDGSANGYGPDSWRFDIDGTHLVNTTFSNGEQGVNFGAYSPQKYSDTTYNGLDGPDFLRFVGADASFSLNQNGRYDQDYSIYSFTHGAGNPILSFTATSSSADLLFARYGPSQDSADEYWALDNLTVSTSIPEPSTLSLIGLIGAGLLRRSRR